MNRNKLEQIKNQTLQKNIALAPREGRHQSWFVIRLGVKA